ncbi:MAG: bifunctional phosphoribosylaminoimidazolecarboxamide formyltransferase/IMP cyclohydrolase, partial [Burkholderiales bacterium]
IAPIDLLAVNLYPFPQTPSIENIDVGGPAMLRAAAKNHERVTVLVDPADYAGVLAELRAGGVGEATRRRLAAKAFAHTAHYDALVSGWLRRQQADASFPDELAAGFRKKQDLRYGENPHQSAAFYADMLAPGASVASARQLQGKALSYNNIADADTAIECVRQFEAPACVIVKHANPCGVAVAATAREAYLRAYEADTTSAFGGIIAFNRSLDEATAAAIVDRQFVEVIAAPACEPGALALLAGKQNLRLLETGPLDPASAPSLELKSVTGGLLAQSRDDGQVDAASLRTVTRRAPDAAELADLLFAWQVCKHVKSNAIVLTRDRALVGMGAGQPSRVDSVRIAIERSQGRASGAVLASDAFFPFRDGPDLALDAGVAAIIQPGGSVRDAETVAACDERSVPMVLTARRHFRH